MSNIARLLLLPASLSLSLAACSQQTPAPAAEAASTPPAATASTDAPVPVPATATATATATAATAAATAAAPKTNPAASPAARDAVVAALREFATLKRYHASMNVVERPGAKPDTHEMDFVAPDRYRIDETSSIIGDTLYTTAKGRTSKAPLPADTLAQWQLLTRLADAGSDLVAEGGKGMMVAGQPSKTYQVRQAKPVPADYALWIGPTGLPIKIEATDSKGSKISIRYSHYDDPKLQIEAPKP